LQNVDATLINQISVLQTSDVAQYMSISTLESADVTHNSQIGALQTSDTAQDGQIGALEEKTQFVTVSSGEMYVIGTNLHILNGMNDTEIINGLGNLIVGYNEPRGFDEQQSSDPNVRTGSHSVIVGSRHNYSSYGGLVVGQSNTISGPYASVSGGSANTASDYTASVSGGQGNTASGVASSVSGGIANVASGSVSSLSGGNSNWATADSSSVSGGVGVGQTTQFGWSGGTYHSP
jgi:hypothetical protein